MPEMILGVAQCCRLWEVALFNHIGKCGLCGNVPELVAYKPLPAYLAEHPEIAYTGDIDPERMPPHD